MKRVSGKISRQTAKACTNKKEEHKVERHSGIPDIVAPEGDVSLARETSKEKFKREAAESRASIRKQREFLARRRKAS